VIPRKDSTKFESKHVECIKTAVDIARQAIATSINPSAHLVGSIGPYAVYFRDGSEYTGAYVNAPGFDPQVVVDYYLAQARPLTRAGVKTLLAETIPSLVEIECLGRAAEQLSDDVEIWVSIACKVG